MLYLKPSFTLPATGGHMAQMIKVCADHGHMDPPDRRGNCWRCGAKIRFDVPALHLSDRAIGPQTGE